ncbi:HK97 family phage prohead protease [Umezawaea beigongshangensis]|uniref:HK97 family phage prohead protease n=1 Tax=Umezawaea beigongshangensis TaxID=2780383 RepID=UPI0018F190AA|nr:HK97 family phage prohead protease [Umezawaea beigongshangensis]
MTDELTLRSAAQARSAQVAARADRPSRRRCAEAETSPARVSAHVRGLHVRDTSGGGLEFDGFATVYERGYEMYDFFGPYTEVVSVGAASDTLARADLDVPLVLQHEDLRRIARTTNGSLILEESDDGLRVHAPELDPADHDVAYIAPKLRSGLIDEMSFKFRITSGHWSPDYTEYRIDAFDIHRGDVAIVGYGANPHTSGSGLRADVDEFVRGLDERQAQRAAAALAARGLLAAPTTPRVLITDEDTRHRVV